MREEVNGARVPSGFGVYLFILQSGNSGRDV